MLQCYYNIAANKNPQGVFGTCPGAAGLYRGGPL